MVFKQTAVPALPCPYCLEVRNSDPQAALWLGPNGGDPDTAKSEIELHMAECDRRDDPVATGFVEASELVGRTNSGFGLADGSERTDNQMTGALKPATRDN
jgi:hypothetical protein